MNNIMSSNSQNVGMNIPNNMNYNTIPSNITTYLKPNVNPVTNNIPMNSVPNNIPMNNVPMNNVPMNNVPNNIPNNVFVKKYTLSKVRQLIDLNGDTINFDIKFNITSSKKEPFEALVIDQTTLDSDPNISYKKISSGELQGNLRHDKNIYQNYYLILRSENPCDVTVTIEKNELPLTPQTELKSSNKNLNQVSSTSSFPWFKLFLVSIIIIGGFAVYYFFLKDKLDKNTKNTSFEKPLLSSYRNNPTMFHNPYRNRISTSSFSKPTVVDKLKNLSIP